MARGVAIARKPKPPAKVISAPQRSRGADGLAGKELDDPGRSGVDVPLVKKAVIEQAMRAEMSDHLGYP